MIPSHLQAARLVNSSYWHVTQNNSKTDVQFYAQDVNGIRYVAFPGTKGLIDMLRNFWFLPAVTPYAEKGYKGMVKIHLGFYRGYLSIQRPLLDIADTKLPLCLCGHSAGGSYAQIAGVDINYKLNKNVDVITFGSPCIGNKTWAISAAKRINNTSYVNPFDYVPFLFPWYKFINPQVWLPNIYQDPHSISNYVKALKY